MKFPLLTSYAYARNWPAEQWARTIGDDRVELLLDSGAFSAFNSGHEILLGDYMQFVGENGNRLFGYMLLDKLQDPVQTDLNLKTMLGAGLKPIPIHVFGEDESKMNELFSMSEWVALGGFRRPHRGWAPASYVKQKMAWAAGRNVHWLGYTNRSMVKAFAPYSCDSSNHTYTTQFGYLLLYLGAGEWTQFYMADWHGTSGTSQCRKLAQRPMRARIRSAVTGMGIDIDRLDDPLEWRGWRTASNATMRSYVRYILDVRRTIGTRQFLATTGQPDELVLLDAALSWAVETKLMGGDR